MAYSVELIDVSTCSGASARLIGVNLAVRTGSITAIRGARGSGKTAVVRLVAGLEQPDAGAVLFAGQAVSGASGRRLRRLQRGMAVMLQGGDEAGCGLFEAMTVLENLAFSLRSAGHLAARRVDAVAAGYLARARMDDLSGERPEALSPSLRRRLALTRALAMHAPLVVLDGLDDGGEPGEAEAICGLIETEREERASTYLVTTRSASLAGRLADQVVGLEHGQVVETVDIAGPLAASPGGI